MGDEEKADGLPAAGQRQQPLQPPPAGDDDQANIVNWDPEDASHPQNWSLLYKSWITFQLSVLALGASVASAIISPANRVIAPYIHVSREIVVLDVSLFVYVFHSGHRFC